MLNPRQSANARRASMPQNARYSSCMENTVMQTSNRNGKRWSLYVLLGTFLLSLTGCSGFQVVRIPIPIPTTGSGERKAAQRIETIQTAQQTFEEEKHIEVGQASWYGNKFHGQRTASGEPYSMDELTAAHPSLPFNTTVKVTNLENGYTTLVRINDRGPFVKGRIIDVSRAAARQLGFELKGIAQVKLETM
jgi:rare lipoprotein A